MIPTKHNTSPNLTSTPYITPHHTPINYPHNTTASLLSKSFRLFNGKVEFLDQLFIALVGREI